jgi:hypothetical protein
MQDTLLSRLSILQEVLNSCCLVAPAAADYGKMGFEHSRVAHAAVIDSPSLTASSGLLDSYYATLELATLLAWMVSLLSYYPVSLSASVRRTAAIWPW